MNNVIKGDVKGVSELKIKLFADGADFDAIRELAGNPLVKGFTTNPTLMKRAGVPDYKEFALKVLEIIGDRHISFEVFADEFDDMEKQALEIASWGKNVFVKIPVTNTRGESSGDLIERLSKKGVQLNVTALMTPEQVEEVVARLDVGTPAVISVFAGRIADTGRDPVPVMAEAARIMRSRPKAELLWASQREIYNIFEAEQGGCHIITATTDALKKLSLIGKDLNEFSLETVKMFYDDARVAGYTIESIKRTGESPNARKKIVTLSELTDIVQDLKHHGKKIVTTNGAFDMLHIGHIRALEESKSLGDVLVVGINSDSSVKRYKSELRPIIPEQERAEMVASLDSVDYVIIFDESDPRNFLEKVKPNVHTKGGDYIADELHEYELITRNGGELVTTDSIKSTTEIIDKILTTYR